MERYVQYNGNTFRLSGEYYKRHITVFLHRQVWEDHFGTIPEGHHIHHKDGNKLNNDISNLECLPVSEHHKRTWSDNYEKMCAVTSANLVPYKRTSKHRERMSEWSKEYWHSKKSQECQCKTCGKPFKSKMSSLAKYCSRKCNNSYNAGKENQREKRICIVCKKDFETSKYQSTLTCGRSCGGKYTHMIRRKNDLAHQQSDFQRA